MEVLTKVFDEKIIRMCISISPLFFCFWLAGTMYAPTMRKAGYVTMYDPFQETYGIRVGALMCVPQFLGDTFWTAAIFAALGNKFLSLMYS